MSSKITIKQVIVQNFRSVKNAKLVVENNNIFVGQNDAGKSNLLKALNLFFNNQTDYGRVFDFTADFTYLYSKRSKRKKEIIIQIIFSIPDHYKVDNDVLWEKRWSIDGSVSENIKHVNGTDLPARSRVPSVLRSMKYRYIPAVKSRDYYKGLLSELYQAVSASLNSPLSTSIGEFTNVLSTYTQQIGHEVLENLGLSSTLTMPSDLSELFKTLVFETKDSASGFVIDLERRGDGIQARHIPYILNYIAEEDQKSKGKRATNVYTIWGFEEPENGLEMTKAFAMAGDFMKYSEHIQMFISTHSPAFYLNGSNDNSKVFYATKNKQEETYYSDSVESADLDERMGILPIIAPYIEKKQAELSGIRAKLEEYKGTLSGDIDTVLVEGKYDKLYLEKAIERYSPSLQSKLTNNKLRIYTKPDKGGSEEIVNAVKSLYYARNKSRIYAIFDMDKAGKDAKNKLQQFIRSESIQNVKNQHWTLTEEMRKYTKLEIAISVEVEHFLSSDFLDKLLKNNKLKEKPNSVIYEIFKSKASTEKSLRETINEVNKRIGYTGLFNEYDPKDNSKEQIYKWVLKELNDDNSSNILEGLEPTVRNLEKFFKPLE